MVAVDDSAHHAVANWTAPIWFVAVRWPRQAGLTLLTCRPLPSDRRLMPSYLWKTADPELQPQVAEVKRRLEGLTRREAVPDR